VLGEANDFPDGVVLATGTGIVPEMDFTLQPGDQVEIEIDEVGRLTNDVRIGKDTFGWLSDDSSARPQMEEAR
jgi:2-dehydro-3-deoxy-D-arabinonate dehydratase